MTNDTNNAGQSDGVMALVEKLVGEGLISMSAAARLYGSSREGKATHATTVVRHATKGVRQADGSVLKLESIRTGGKIMTSNAAVMRFFAAQQSGGQSSAVQTSQSSIVHTSTSPVKLSRPRKRPLHRTM